MKLTAGGPVQGESLSKSKLVSVVGKGDKSGKEGRTARGTKADALEKVAPAVLTTHPNNEKKITIPVLTDKLTGRPVRGESLSKNKLVSIADKDDMSGKEGKTAHATRTVVLEKGTPKTLTPYANNEKKPTLHVFTGNAAVGDAQKAVGEDRMP